jgi:hypothetical protein
MLPYSYARSEASMPKSTHNKQTRTPAEWLELMNRNVIEGMARIALGDVPCGICRGAGVTRYQPARGQDKLLERTCESCYGSGKEKISPELSGQMYAQLAKYVYPQLMQMEVRTDPATAAPALQIVFVEPKRPCRRLLRHRTPLILGNQWLSCPGVL